MKNVTVINKGAEAFVGRFDGHEYTFAPNEPTTIPLLVAGFLFAYGKPDAERPRAMQRNGWLRVSDPHDEFGPKGAEKRLASFIFKKAPDDPERAKPQPKKLDAAAISTAQTINLPGRSAPPAPQQPAA